MTKEPMTKGQRARRARLRRAARTLRRLLEAFDQCPRDARAWARRDRLEVLITQLETNPPTPTKEDPAALLRVSEELRAWWRREMAFHRDYPIFAVPAEWTRRRPRRG